MTAETTPEDLEAVKVGAVVFGKVDIADVDREIYVSIPLLKKTKGRQSA